MKNFSPRAEQILALARKEVVQCGDDMLNSEHLLLGLLRLGQGVGWNALHSLNLSGIEILENLTERLEEKPPGEYTPRIPFSPSCKKVLSLAEEESKHLKHSYVDSEHILLGIVKLGEGPASDCLTELGVGLDKLRFEVQKQRDPNYGEVIDDEKDDSQSRDD